MCRERRPRLDCTSAQSNQDNRSPFTSSLDSADCIIKKPPMRQRVYLYAFCIRNPSLADYDVHWLSKQRRSRSIGFWRSQLIWICTVCHWICECLSKTWIKLSEWLEIRSGRGILIYSAWEELGIVALRRLKPNPVVHFFVSLEKYMKLVKNLKRLENFSQAQQIATMFIFLLVKKKKKKKIVATKLISVHTRHRWLH